MDTDIRARNSGKPCTTTVSVAEQKKFLRGVEENVIEKLDLAQKILIETSDSDPEKITHFRRVLKFL